MESVSGNGRCVFPRRRVVLAHEKRLSFRPISTGFCSPEAYFHWGARVFWAPLFGKNKTAFVLGHLQRLGATSRIVFVSKLSRVADETHGLFDTMGTVLRKCLPGQLFELREQVVLGAPPPLKTLDKSTVFIIHPAMLCNHALSVNTPHSATPRTYGHYKPPKPHKTHPPRGAHPATRMYVHTCHNFCTSQHNNAFTPPSPTPGVSHEHPNHMARTCR